jgi:CHAT domain/FHA domain
MPQSDRPCLSIAIAPLTVVPGNHFATWVLRSPYAGGYVHHDCTWSSELAQIWQAWQQLFSLQPLPSPLLPDDSSTVTDVLAALKGSSTNGYSSLLMQKLGLSLWQWLFAGSIQPCFAQSQGIAIGQGLPLRVRLELRDPYLIGLPWEIMQPQPGKPSISLSPQLLFSRTTSDVDELSHRLATDRLNILLVLGQDTAGGDDRSSLDLHQEVSALSQAFQQADRPYSSVPYCVDTLIQPTLEQLVEQLECKDTHILLYAGHGTPAPDGGKLFLAPGVTLSGTELAQVLVRTQVTLAAFNSCWGAQPDLDAKMAIPRSSLAEVLIHHGVPAVLAMRDTIADREALTFIQAFAGALAQQHPVDRAVAIARQQLLTLYKFNQPAWTLPVLYMHPAFDGCLVASTDGAITELPLNSHSRLGQPLTNAFVRSTVDRRQVWQVKSGLMRVGRTNENDLAIAERWVSKRHAEIFYRQMPQPSGNIELTYYLRDYSRYGTLVLGDNGWEKIHHQEVPLHSGIQLKFGSSQGQAVEFLVEAIGVKTEE